MVAVDQSGRDQPSLQIDRLALRRRDARRPDVANKMAVDDNIDWSVARPGIFPYQCQASNQGLPDVFSSIFAIGMRPYSAEATARRDTSNARRASSPRRRRARCRTKRGDRHNPGCDPLPSKWCKAGVGGADVRFGSEADIRGRLGNVRFTPKADIAERDRHVRFVLAKSRHMQCSKSRPYSITSSARDGGDCGTERPSALAVI